MNRLLQALSWLLFLVVLIPVSWTRRLRQSSRFGRKFHRAPSAWDLPLAKVEP